MTEGLGETIRRVLRDAPFAMRQLAADAGLSYDVLRSWRSGRRRPSKPSAQRLADGLERRGEQLIELARELRRAAESGAAGVDEGARPDGAGQGPAEVP
jgi:transcriptional regulator with XRE-family HTH domain